ncbi:MAG: hypothetical protein M3P06_05410 [Acidobacteriota bacterium]|nr:hypothetical protein [Acidobacteriota bacterium]
MVTDGSLDFDTGGFGLSEFVGIVTAAGHTVSTGHRSGIGPVTIAGNFTFNNTVTTANYDQIWLFGFETAFNAISAAEQTVIAQFMENGGGVFATGDHENLGAGMGTMIPRVRSMREWNAISGSSTSRLDTVVNPGVDGIYQFHDQSDMFAQRIFPIFYSNGGSSGSASTWSPHPVLRHPSGAVDFFPDHAHESECLAPTPVAGNFGGVEEWPMDGGSRIAPQIVAVSISGGRFLTDVSKPPVSPRCFGAVSTYDGDAAAVGRIVCDATWHHFVNINLNGTGATADTTSAARTGLYSGASPTSEYLKIQRYWLNTVRWLAPIGRRNCWPWIIAALTRYDFEVREFKLPLPHPCPWEPLVRLGAIFEEVVSNTWGRGVMAEVVDDMLAVTGAAPALAGVLKSRRFARGDERLNEDVSLLPLNDLRRAVFASVVNVIARELPEDERKLSRVVKALDHKLVDKHLAEGISGAQQSINEHLQRALASTGAAIKALSVDRADPKVGKKDVKAKAKR